MTIWRGCVDFVRRSLARKLVAAVLLVYSLLIGVFGWELVGHERQTLERGRSSRAQGLAGMLATSGNSWVLSEDEAGLRELIASASAMPAHRYSFFTDESGRVLAHSNPENVGFYVRKLPATTSGAPEPKAQSLAVAGGAIDATAPVIVNGEVVGWAWTSLDMRDIHAEVSQLAWRATLFGAIALTVGLLIALAVAQGITERIAELAAVADRFRQGNRDSRIRVRGIDEVAVAAAGVNEMLEALAASERSLREVQQIASLGSWRYDQDKPTLEWSDEVYRLFNMDRQGPAPTFEQFLSMLPPEQQLSMRELAAEESHTVSRYTLTITHPDGTERICWAEARREVNASGKRILTGVCQDITEREVAAAQLHQAQKMEAVGQLTGGLAHDFNNLLAIAIGNLDLANEDLPEGSPVKESVEEALEAVLRGSELTKHLLAFSRRQPLSARSVDINALIRGFEPLLRGTIGSKIELRINLAPEIWPTKVDPTQVEAAILNLCINARDAMSEGGTLTIDTANLRLGPDAMDTVFEINPGAYSVITVTDTGHGMCRETLERACEPFFTTKDVGRGSGLGLSMIYGFAQQSGGDLKIYSEPGHGTVVRLYLPVSEAPAEDALNGAHDEKLPVSHGEKILLVEDDDGVRRIVERQLNELHYEVISAINGPQALALLDKEAVDVLFTDIAMPGGMSGIELGRQARKAFPNLKILYTSGFTQPGTSGLQPSASLLSKPYRKSDLAIRLREVIDSPTPARQSELAS